MNNNFRPRSSATALGVGIVALAIGQMVYTNGAQRAAVASVFSNDGSSTMAVGAVITVIGLVSLIVGVVRIAQAVDYLARREHARSVIASTTPSAAPGVSAEVREAAARGQAIIDEGR